jgi:hypothetical protein
MPVTNDAAKKDCRRQKTENEVLHSFDQDTGSPVNSAKLLMDFSS